MTLDRMATASDPERSPGTSECPALPQLGPFPIRQSPPGVRRSRLCRLSVGSLQWHAAAPILCPRWGDYAAAGAAQ